MQLLYKLIRNIPAIAVDEVIIGVHSTLVKSGEKSGLASTIKYCGPGENVRHAGELETHDLKALAEYVLSDNLLEASVGMAAVNCFYSAQVRNYRAMNAKDILLEKGRNRNVGIIGHFPFLEEQKKYYRNCFIFEKQPREGDLREKDIPVYLPKAEVTAITATSITNHSFENIIPYLPAGSFNIILGPSTPLTPILFDYGIDAISGSVIENYEKVKKCVLQATPTRKLQGIKMLTLFREDEQ